VMDVVFPVGSGGHDVMRNGNPDAPGPRGGAVLH
jgi:hypothetical protein